MKTHSHATVPFIALTVLAVAVLPLDLGWNGNVPFVTLASADAKNEGGKGGGQGGKGGSSSKGGKAEKGPNGKAKGRAAPAARKDVTSDSLAVRYHNGYFEQVTKGRFIMKDSKGRTIVDRKATAQDHMRLWLKTIVP